MYIAQEFTKKQEKAVDERKKGYRVLVLKDNDLVYFWRENGKL